MNTHHSFLRLENLSVQYQSAKETVPSVQNISFEIQNGQCMVLLGESGSGKTTVARAMTGLLPPSASVTGTLSSHQFSWDLSNKKQNWPSLRGRHIGVIFQDSMQSLNPMRRIGDHFCEILLTHKMCLPHEVEKTSSELLEFLNFRRPDEILRAWPFQLSGGMAQRVSIALSLSLKPSVLIADEATSALDTSNQVEVFRLLQKCQRQLGLALLCITHDLTVAQSMKAQQVMVLRHGLVEEKGSRQSVMDSPKSSYTKCLLQALQEMPQREPFSCHPENKNSHPILSIQKLSKRYDQNRQTVLKGLSLSLTEGEILGIFGESGCGKSTLSRCVLGLEEWKKGQIFFRGENLAHSRTHNRRKMCQQIQIVFQDARGCLNPRRTIGQLLREPAECLGLSFDVRDTGRGVELLAEVGLPPNLLSRRPPELSTGQCQRVAIARALSVSPQLLVCDEAVSALDTLSTNQILHLLLRIHRSRGLSMIMISHDFRMLRRFCHRVAVMEQGQLCDVVRSCEVPTTKGYRTEKLLACCLERELALESCCET